MTRPKPPEFMKWFRRLLVTQNEDDGAAISQFADEFEIFSYDPHFVVDVFRPSTLPVDRILADVPYARSFWPAVAAAAESKGLHDTNIAILILNCVHVGNVVTRSADGWALTFVDNFPYEFAAPGLPATNATLTEASMIRVVCRHDTLASVPDLPAVSEYNKLVRPLDYNCGVETNMNYAVVGIVTQNGTPWLYASSLTEETEVQFLPAALFTSEWSEIPPNWRVRFGNRGEIEVLPRSLAGIPAWFERYIDGEPAVVAAVHRELT